MGLTKVTSSMMTGQTLTYRIPADFPNLQTAVDSLSPTVNNDRITLLFQSGHQPSSGLLVSDGDFSQFTISSEDAEVVVSGDFSIVGYNARMPVLNCLINLAASTLFDSFGVSRGSIAVINSGCGMKNGDRGLHVENASICYADGAVFTGFQQAGLHVSRASICQCTGANFSGNSQDPANTFGSVYASRASNIHGADINASNSGGDGVRTQRLAVASVPGVNVSGAKKIALVAVSGSSIYSESSAPIMLNLQERAIVAQQGGKIVVNAATVTFAAGVVLPAVEARSSIVVCTNSSFSGHQGTGIFAQNASVDAGSVTITGGANGIFAEKTAHVNATSATITNVTANGVFARQGGYVCLQSASVTGSGSNDISIETGSWVTANGCSTTSSAGTPALADTSATGFNFADNGNRGFIWD